MRQKLAISLTSLLILMGVLYPVPSSAATPEPLDAVNELLEKKSGLRESGSRPNVAVADGGISVDTGLDLQMIRQLEPGKTKKRFETESEVVVGSTVAQGTEAGFRLIEVIEGRQSQHEFEYQARVGQKKAAFELQDDGSVVVGLRDGQGFEPIASVDSPWAFDASGEAVSVEYRVGQNGHQLIMAVTQVDDSQYPIVADPSVHYSWWGYTYKFNRSETDALIHALLTVGTGSGLAGAVCTGTTAGLCSVPWAIYAGIVLLGRIAIIQCANSRGLDIHRSYAGAVWCSGY